MFKNLFSRRKLAGNTLANLEKMLIAYEFPPGLRSEILDDFQKRMDKDGTRQFNIWYGNLHYSTPEEYQDEMRAEKIYDSYPSWIEKEVDILEKETGLPWEEQTNDIPSSSEKARKVKLVIRHRLSEIQLDLLDSGGLS